MKLFISSTLACLVWVHVNAAPALEKGNESLVQKYAPAKAPQTKKLLLKKGDRLAICGDSITEQKMYSRIIEDYLTMCAPELGLEVRQYGWGGERASNFHARMTNDCLRFKPTIATTSFGMNDHEYRAYENRIGQAYRSNSLAVIQAFKANKIRVVQGSPGCVGKIPWWQKGFTTEDLNQNLCTLRNIGVELATEHKAAGYADVFWPMLQAQELSKMQYGTNFAIAGKDGVHPGWAGHTLMAYAYLKALGLNGEIGTFTVDLKRNRMKVTKGHDLVGASGGVFEIKSSRYPFCPVAPVGAAKEWYPVVGIDNTNRDDSIQSGMTFVPFYEELNRLMLVVKNAESPEYRVTWGTESKVFTRGQLKRGINLAKEFVVNPFSAAYGRVDTAVAAKQAFETEEIKSLFRPAGKPTMAQIVEQTDHVMKTAEKKHQGLVNDVQNAFVPVTHSISIVAVE